jgi:hypothetical protein
MKCPLLKVRSPNLPVRSLGPIPIVRGLAANDCFGTQRIFCAAMMAFRLISHNVSIACQPALVPILGCSLPSRGFSDRDAIDARS